MEQLHAHEVLHMMEGNSYSEASLKKRSLRLLVRISVSILVRRKIRMRMELIVFLKQKGKFMPVENGFTVDITKVCNH